VLQSVAVCSSVLQCIAVRCSMLQSIDAELKCCSEQYIDDLEAELKVF